MATNNTAKPKEDKCILNISVPKGSDLADRIEDYCGDNDCSGAAFLRQAVEMLLTASGRPPAKEEKAA
jgi:hypothetical protein